MDKVCIAIAFLLFALQITFAQDPYVSAGCSNSYPGVTPCGNNALQINISEVACRRLGCCFQEIRGSRGFIRRCWNPIPNLINILPGGGYLPTGSPDETVGRGFLVHGGENNFPGSSIVFDCRLQRRCSGMPLYYPDWRFPWSLAAYINRCRNRGCCYNRLHRSCRRRRYYITYLRDKCPPGFANPPKCEVVDQCTTGINNENPCQNGASCNNLFNQFSCDCPTGISGATCTEVCLTVPSVANAVMSIATPGVTGPPFNVDNQITFTCNTGFRPIGTTTLTCDLTSRQFTPIPPFCVRTCTELPPTGNPNLQITPDKPSYDEGETVFYSCLGGLILEPDPATNECRNGQWTSSPPTCYTCRQPPPITVGLGTYTPSRTFFNLGSVITYRCLSGFNLVGTNTNQCIALNTWSVSPTAVPQCIADVAACGLPPTFPGASIVNPPIGNPVIGETFQYTCSDGFYQSGPLSSVLPPVVLPGTVMCTTLPSGPGYTGSIECTAGCPQPSFPTGTIFPPQLGYPPGAVITLRCSQDQSLSPPPPPGLLFTCDVDTLTFPDVSTYSCSPNCVNPLPSAPTGAEINPIPTPVGSGTYPIGTTVTYVCLSTSAPGSITIECLDGGTWTTPVLTCTSQPCGAFPSAPPNSGITSSPTEVTPGTNMYAPGSIVSYQCDTNYAPTAVVTITCQASGNWQILSLTCVRECPDPTGLVPGATFTATASNESPYTVGEFVTWACSTPLFGFANPAEATSTCTTGGTWSPLGVCVRTMCSAPPDLTPAGSGTIDVGVATTFADGTMLTYMCANGFDSRTSLQTTCQASTNSWSLDVTNPLCIRICETPPADVNAVITFTSPTPAPTAPPYLVGDQISYNCPGPFYMNGIGVTTNECLIFGGNIFWMNSAAVVCVCVDPPQFGNTDNTGTPYFTLAPNILQTPGVAMITYNCAANHVVVPAPAATSSCDANGMWTTDVSTAACVRACSTAPPALTPAGSGTIDVGVATTFADGTMLTYMCANGFDSRTSLQTTCQASTNSWSLDVTNPLCIRICETPPADVNAVITFTSPTPAPTAPPYLVGDQISYNCPGPLYMNGIGVTTNECLIFGGNIFWMNSAVVVCACVNPPPFGNTDNTGTPYFTLTSNGNQSPGIATVTYNCASSYLVRPVSATTNMCNSAGMWTIDVTTAMCVGDCGTPPAVANAMTFTTAAGPTPSTPDYIAGTSIFYICNDGFTMQNPSLNENQCSGTMWTRRTSMGGLALPVCRQDDQDLNIIMILSFLSPIDRCDMSPNPRPVLEQNGVISLINEFGTNYVTINPAGTSDTSQMAVVAAMGFNFGLHCTNTGGFTSTPTQQTLSTQAALAIFTCQVGFLNNILRCARTTHGSGGNAAKRTIYVYVGGDIGSQSDADDALAALRANNPPIVGTMGDRVYTASSQQTVNQINAVYFANLAAGATTQLGATAGAYCGSTTNAGNVLQCIQAHLRSSPIP